MKCYEIPKYTAIICLENGKDIDKVKVGKELLKDLIERGDAVETEVPHT